MTGTQDYGGETRITRGNNREFRHEIRMPPTSDHSVRIVMHPALANTDASTETIANSGISADRHTCAYSYGDPGTDCYPTRVPTPTPKPSPTPEPTAIPEPTPTPAPTPTPKPPTPAQIFARISPSLAFIQTPAGTGSGVLIEGGYVVTNAHVVWPFEQVRVVFPDGSEHVAAPILGSDAFGDLAVIGPLKTSLPSVSMVNGEHLPSGSDVYLIGYPAENERFPQPAITRGILSRLREWEALGMTYFQTDAAAAGGQSGGVLVSDDGEVIGISGLVFSEARFGIVASAADVLERVEGIIDGQDLGMLGDRELLLENGGLNFDVSLGNLWDSRTFIANEQAESTLEIEAEGWNDVQLFLGDRFGNEVIFADACGIGIESGTATTRVDAPYFLIIAQNSVEPGDFRVKSNVPLYPYDDSDDEISVAVGQTIRASMDYPRDFDYFLIDLEEGQTIEVSVDSINFDPVVRVDYVGAEAQEAPSDDDSGGGIFGTNARLNYRAPHAGSYFIVVNDASAGSGFGGYFLKIASAPQLAVAENSAASQPATGPRVSQYDEAIKENPQSGKAYSLRGLAFFSQGEYQRSIEDFDEAIRLSPNCASPYSNRGHTRLLLNQFPEALADFDKAIQLYPQYSQAFSGRGHVYVKSAEYQRSIEDFDQALRLDPQNQDGYFGRALAYTMTDRDADAKKDSDRAVELGLAQAVVDIAISEFKKKQARHIAARPHYRDAVAYYKEGQHQKAIDQFSLAIQVNPDFADAYGERARTYLVMGQYHKALEDFGEAIRLNSGKATYYLLRGLTYSRLDQDAKAIVDYSEAIRLAPQFEAYNNRGHTYKRLGEYKLAIEDYDEAIRLKPNVTSYNNRGDAYHLLGQYERAIEDHTEAIRLAPLKDKAFYYNNRGRDYHQSGQYQRAIGEYDAAINRDVGYVRAYANRALAYTFLGRDTEARNDVGKAVELGADRAELEKEIDEIKSRR